LWHGAQWTFVLWGLCHGIGLAIHERWDHWYKGKCRVDRRWVGWRKSSAYGAGAWLITQGFFVLTLVLFRAASLNDAGLYVRGLAGSGSGRGVSLGIQLMLAILFLIAYHLPPLRRGGTAVNWFLGLPAPVRGVAYGMMIVLVLLFSPVGAGTFIYAQF
jgi:alginate O-acetyltransferase complex protein AlgI